VEKLARAARAHLPPRSSIDPRRHPAISAMLLNHRGQHKGLETPPRHRDQAMEELE